MRQPISALLLTTVLCACGRNPYGYAPQYAPLSEEEPHYERGLELSYEDVRRDPLGHQSKTLAWFGVVEDVKPVGSSGQVRVALSLRFQFACNLAGPLLGRLQGLLDAEKLCLGLLP